ncbi:hypothetical protein K1719_007284 [Acacia pycnantha]|nr:hypothetical protein K1719_007284 [Acacia pycnantha]
MKPTIYTFDSPLTPTTSVGRPNCYIQTQGTKPFNRCITSLPFLRIINLIGNRISSMNPAHIDRLQQLTVLNVVDNQISGARGGGREPRPTSVTNLSELMHLDLRNNRITRSLSIPVMV